MYMYFRLSLFFRPKPSPPPPPPRQPTCLWLGKQLNMHMRFIYLCHLHTHTHSYTIRDQELDDGMVSELGISHTYRQDTGIYICQASNAFGQVSCKADTFVWHSTSEPWYYYVSHWADLNQTVVGLMELGRALVHFDRELLRSQFCKSDKSLGYTGKNELNLCRDNMNSGRNAFYIHRNKTKIYSAYKKASKMINPYIKNIIAI